MKVGEMTPGPLKMLWYGPPGTGKTLLALTVGEVGQIIDIDMGVESALGRVRQDPNNPLSAERLKVDWYPCAEPAPTVQAVQYEKVLQTLITINNMCQPNAQQKYPFKVLIIDSFTSLCDSATRYVLRNSGRLNRPADVKSGNITQPEWGLIINEVEKIVQLIRSLPIHVILIAHTVLVKNDNGAPVKHEIAIPTQRLPPRIPAYFDELWFFEVQDIGQGRKERTIRTEASFLYDAKSRAGLADKTSVDVGMKEIFKRLGREI